MAAPAQFVVFEGLDGAGSTTQARLFVEALAQQGVPVVATAEPSDGPVGNLIRQALRRRVVLADGDRLDGKTIAALFAGDRIDHLRSRVEPALAAGTHVVSDRYVHSSLAYQSVECDLDWVVALNSQARDADITFWIDTDTDRCIARIQARGIPVEIFEKHAFLERARRGYASAIAHRPHNVHTIAGDGTVDEVHQAVMAQWQKHLERLAAGK